MKKITMTDKVMTLVILLLTIMLILTNTKVWNYKKIQSVEYNPSYNEKFPVSDVLEALYENINKNNPIKLRKFEGVLKGHTLFGEANGGSRLSLIHIDSECPKCKKYWLALLCEQQPRENYRDSTSSISAIVLP